MPEKRKKGWTQVAFGGVVRLCRERSSAPSEDGFERYIGLEHLEPGDLEIRRWGSTAEGTTFTNVFRAGQVLFGKRRAYQHKVAVADFDGVCSGDIYVLESADSKRLLPELLPFICQTDRFFEHAVGTSAGSLSPRTNWESLASFEFALPLLDEQRRIAEVLGAVNETAQEYDNTDLSAEIVFESLLIKAFRGDGLGPLAYDERFGRYCNRLALTPLGDLLTTTQYGLSEPSVSRGRYPMLRMMDLSDGLAVDKDLCCVDLSDEDFERYRLEEGDVLFNRTNSHDLVGRTGVYRLDGSHVFASYLVRLKTKPQKLLPDYLCAFLNATLGRRQVMRFATRGVSQTNVNASNLRSVLIPLPSTDYQADVVRHIEGLRRGRAALQRKSRGARALGANIANDIWG